MNGDLKTFQMGQPLYSTDLISWSATRPDLPVLGVLTVTQIDYATKTITLQDLTMNGSPANVASPGLVQSQFVPASSLSHFGVPDTIFGPFRLLGYERVGNTAHCYIRDINGNINLRTLRVPAWTTYISAPTGSQMPLDLAEEISSPLVNSCSHTFVNVGFSSLKMVCSKCNCEQA